MELKPFYFKDRNGHVAGSELDGRTIPHDASLEGLVSKKKTLLVKGH